MLCLVFLALVTGSATYSVMPNGNEIQETIDAQRPQHAGAMVYALVCALASNRRPLLSTHHCVWLSVKVCCAPAQQALGGPDALYKNLSSLLSQACSSNAHHASSLPEPLDLVITWRPNHVQHPVKNLADGYDDLKFSLRSFEKHGLLDIVRKVFIMVGIDDATAAKLGAAPEYLKRSGDTRLTFVSSPQAIGAKHWCAGIGVGLDEDKKNGIPLQWCLTAKLHSIPDLSEYFLLAPDDLFLLQDVTRQSLYTDLFDPNSQLPYLYSHGGLGDGDCWGAPDLAPLHGIGLISKCLNAETDTFLLALYEQMRRDGANVTSESVIDPLCVSKTAAQKVKLISETRITYKATPPGDSRPFFEECHTNGGCDMPPTEATFANIQGNGLSEEYPDDEEVRQRFLQWFLKVYPSVSRFEVPPTSETASG